MNDKPQPQPESENYVISKENRNILVEYLAGRPWREVVGLINMLAQLPPLNDAK